MTSFDALDLIKQGKLEGAQRSVRFPAELAALLDDVAKRHDVAFSHVVVSICLAGLEELTDAMERSE